MRRLIGFLLPLLLLLSGGCGEPALQRFSLTYVDTFDTVVQLVAYDTDAMAFQRKAEEFHRRLQEFDRLYDIYTPAAAGESTLYTVNQQAGVAPVVVDEKIVELLLFGKEIYTLSGGQVNIAAGAVLQLWHDARTAGLASPETAVLPDREALTEAAVHGDIDKLIIDREAGTVFLADPDMSLDVGAIAKGYATEQLCRWAETQWTHAAVSAGGNVRTIGTRADGSPWNIGVEHPDREATDYLATVSLTGCSLVTSGDYQRYYTVDGVDYHHLIDPKTGMPAGYFRSTTVMCEDSGLADGLSTALFLMPLADGQALIASLEDVEALWVLPDGTTAATDGFTEMRSDI